jgi:hypothetical protein
MKRLKIRMMVEMYLYKTCMSSTNEMFRADETAIVIVVCEFSSFDQNTRNASRLKTARGACDA